MVDALELGPPVVISPSLSGMYALPFLVAPGSQLRGYVPVAPICTDKINAADYASVKVLCVCVCVTEMVSQEQDRVHPWAFFIWELGNQWGGFWGDPFRLTYQMTMPTPV